MRREVKKEILNDLTKTIEILKQRELQDVEQLKDLSDHSIEDVALYKNLDLISVTVLIYSIYKVVRQMKEENYKDLIAELEFARNHLQQGNFARYNKSVKSLFKIVRSANASVKTHLQDVMDAARIKKGAVLLQKGLSLGQAAGLMGLSNWDLQQYAGRTKVMDSHYVSVSAKKRLELALKLFGV
ncbi:hypothetical protein HOE37_05105 [Candidatus Woesearchaeota archaeon]|jgi:hypothetical protein|nr:hypothetical protein [Candidatus Woesearchaeota archaeon]MBT4111210.1 hypothetical protein [Candidatus Woesearchaeota archaeon]MBT4336790.1 hypothetical protein [Candidatus Woesearchaeota archaeon]MBT4469458.1 hypothetical protein [Candidatus Woesearchaeota archaeon]MBT6744147.1 hypothetical protein [Candidatus Woesearchaeota archaeon]